MGRKSSAFIHFENTSIKASSKLQYAERYVWQENVKIALLS